MKKKRVTNGMILEKMDSLKVGLVERMDSMGVGLVERMDFMGVGLIERMDSIKVGLVTRMDSMKVELEKTIEDKIDANTKTLLHHMQGAKHGLELSMKEMGSSLGKRIDRLEDKVNRGFAAVDQNFIQVNQHLGNLEEDLNATIKMQARHERKLGRLQV